MADLFTPFIQNDRQQRLYHIAEQVAGRMKARVKEADEQALFLEENLHDMKELGYVTMTLPKEFGGEGISLYELVLLQEKVATGDGAAALSIGWHLGVVKELGEERPWDATTFDAFAKDLGENKKVVNRLATEPATGSPTRGGIPQTKAIREGSYYILNGRKSFATMASVLDYYLVTAYVEEKDAVGSFLMEKGETGITIEHTWDTLGMRGTGSDDVIFQNVKVPVDALVELKSKGNKPKGWLLHIPACYLGIAIAARNDVLEFAKNYQPNSLDKPIAYVPHVQNKLGEIELELLQARTFMYSIAEKWDKHPNLRDGMGAELAAVKVIATNAASKVVDLAMRIVGGRGLSKHFPFEKYYRDVRAGLHNPPMEDAVISMLANKAIEE